MPKYEGFSKEELLRFIEKQEQELKQKKYGLVWDAEREPEQVVLDCENNLPVLKRVKGNAVKEPKNNGDEDNILIEGDNYHALTVLNYTHKEKIDVIYIDPPYNTGAQDWKYNNNYVEEDDGFKHSKWLNMMEKRLNLARELLTDNGFLIIAIDNHELFNLGLLCDKIMDEKNRLGMVTVLHNPKGRNFTKFFSANSEYMLVYSKNINLATFNDIAIDDELKESFNLADKNGKKYRLEPLMRSRTETLRENKPGFWYPIYVSKDLAHLTLEHQKNYHEVYPIASNGKQATWINLPETFNEKNKRGIFVARIEGTVINIYRKYYEQQVYKNVWTDKKYQSEFHGTNLIKQILNGNLFNYPKSLYAVEDILKLTAKENSFILDFFAGSGTTGHAVLKLNKEDGGNRKFILCTNNENNICTEVCYPRIEKVIKGYKKNGNGEKVEGLGGNLQYFKTAMVKKSNNKDQIRLNLTRECTEMLCVKENIFNLETEKEDYKIYSANKNDKFLGIYYNFLDNSLSEFIKEVKKLKGNKIVYMFSADDTIDKNLFKGIKDLTIEAIPQCILDVYKQLVKMNIPVKKELIFLEINKAKIKIFEEKEKNEGARILRIVLEKTIQKISQNSGLNIYSSKGKEEKISNLNDLLKKEKLITQVEWEETKTYLTIGNHASHGDYAEYDLDQVQNFYKHIQNLLNKFNI